MSEPQRAYLAKAFGLTWQSDVQLEHFSACTDDGPVADVLVHHQAKLSIRSETRRVNRGLVCQDGFRFAWEDHATFDMYDGNRVAYVPGPGWTGELPWPFYSTVAALLLAWRGGLAFHGSALAVDGQGILICGESGAGKSALLAALSQQGAQLVSDDLAYLQPVPGRPGFQLITGRPGIRLLPEIAQLLPDCEMRALPGDPRGKIMFIPGRSISCDPVPLKHILVLGDPVTLSSFAERDALLCRHAFRPNWMAVLPQAERRRAQIRDLAFSAEFTSIPPLGMVDRAGLHQKAAAILSTIRSPLAANAAPIAKRAAQAIAR